MTGVCGSTRPICAGSGFSNAANPIDRVYAAAQVMNAMNLPYYKGSRQLTMPPPSTGYDCSACVSWVLWRAGIYNGPTSWAWVSGEYSQWGAPGRGAQMTVWFNGGHIFIEFYNRPAKRFDTVPGGDGGDGPHLRSTPLGSPSDVWETIGFQAHHWPGF